MSVFSSIVLMYFIRLHCKSCTCKPTLFLNLYMYSLIMLLYCRSYVKDDLALYSIEGNRYDSAEGWIPASHGTLNDYEFIEVMSFVCLVTLALS